MKSHSYCWAGDTSRTSNNIPRIFLGLHCGSIQYNCHMLLLRVFDKKVFIKVGPSSSYGRMVRLRTKHFQPSDSKKTTSLFTNPVADFCFLPPFLCCTTICWIYDLGIIDLNNLCWLGKHYFLLILQGPLKFCNIADVLVSHLSSSNLSSFHKIRDSNHGSCS